MSKSSRSNRHTLKPEKRREMFALQFGRCPYCGCEMDPAKGAEGPAANTQEHIFPRALYPERMKEYGNRVLVCKQCNTQKGDRPLVVFLAELARQRDRQTC